MLDPDHPSNAQTTAASSVRSGGGGGDDAGADDGDGRETRGFDEKHSLSAAQKLLLDEPARGGADELCFGAPRPWSPLAAKRRRLTFDLGNATSMLDAAARLQEEEEDDEDAIEEEGGKGRPRRSLAAFKTASLGGKTGPSCDLKAALKARQGCSEARALKRCEQESKTRKEVGAEEQTLASCLQDIRSCPASHAQLRRTAVKLKGMQYLAMASPACIVHHAGGGCAPLTENKETGLLMGGCGERGGGPKVGCDAAAGFENRVPMPPADGFKGRKRYGKCAVVGNSMNLFDTENGKHIDRYDAVFRFNSEWRRMHHVTKDTKNVKLEDKGKYMGDKTTFRLVNRKYTTSLLDGDAASQDISPEEEVLFWNYFSAPYLRSLMQKHPKLSFHLAAADLVNWEMEAFSLLRKDFYRLGLGPFDCYRFLSSGVHGIFMALKMCSDVDVYGFSVSMDNFAASFNHGRPSESHDWGFETMLMRLLYFSKAINVCNA